ncbi:CopD family protein [Thiohalomonas denitrificans]|uniref:Uncharacterized membrane protein n=1 Tax=Thiohalomonas denitrificans TaxID=415747 RepID=A0A1G5QIS9_9GAMM|nr:CopD family protein [Thiohalomonas denitrificans]SCZ61592.1 Uncharacterized membrane protein [Thiohalomonas denitrificans]
MSIMLALHVLAVIVWVGGMFFAHQVLRPVAAVELEPPERQVLWNGVFRRFFAWVWAAVILILVTGYWLIFAVYGGMANVGVYVHIMNGIGLVMIALFVFLFFVPYRGFRQAVAERRWPDGKQHLDRIRAIVGINLLLGLITAAIGSGGRLF